MTFVGIMTLLSGLISCLGCISILSGVLLAAAGTVLLRARAELDEMASINASTRPFFEKLRLFMQLTGFVYIASIVMGLILFLFFFSLIAAAVSSALQGLQ